MVTRFPAVFLSASLRLVASIFAIAVAANAWGAGAHRLAHRHVGSAPGGDFTLQSPGGDVSLSDFRGKVVALYFGYTYCPDICPTTLAALAEALKSLPPEEQRQIQGIFVSFDPERDDAVRLKGYVEFFYPGLVGLTGSPEQIDRVAARYGVLHRPAEVQTAGGYVIDHSSVIYLVDRRGKLVRRLPHGTTGPSIARALHSIVAPH